MNYKLGDDRNIFLKIFYQQRFYFLIFGSFFYTYYLVIRK